MEEDKTLTCADCGQTFVYAVAEQHLYEGQGMEEPEICIDCRRRRRDKSSSAIREGEGGGVGGPFTI